MTRSTLVRVFFAICALTAPGARADDVPSQEPPHEDWSLAFAPYVWATGLEFKADANLLGQEIKVDVDESPKDILEDLEFGVMGVIDARYQRLVGLFDGAYSKVGDESNVLNGRLDADVKLVILDGKAGFRVFDMNAPWGWESWRSPRIRVDALAGMRYWWSEIDAHFNGPLLDRHISPSTDWADPILGARIAIGITETINVSLIGDAGGFDINGIDSSRLTWMVLPSLNWRPWHHFSFHAGWKHLRADRAHDSELTLSGALIGAAFHF
jgi:hypothetical protein